MPRRDNFEKKISWLFDDFLTFDMRASQRNQAYQIKPFKKFLVRTCCRFLNPATGFQVTDILTQLSRKCKLYGCSQLFRKSLLFFMLWGQSYKKTQKNLGLWPNYPFFQTFFGIFGEYLDLDQKVYSLYHPCKISFISCSWLDFIII